jgi:hypothetical protein
MPPVEGFLAGIRPSLKTGPYLNIRKKRELVNGIFYFLEFIV